jgi:predicted phosphodiesterase
MRHEDAYIYPRAKALVDSHLTVNGAARALVDAGASNTTESARQVLMRTLRGEFPNRKPFQWELPWPYDLFNDRACTELERIEVYRTAKILIRDRGIEVKAPKDTFGPPLGTKTDSGLSISDATGTKIGDEIEAAILQPIFDTREVPQSADEILGGFIRAQEEKKLHDRSQTRAHVDMRHVHVPICIMGHSDVHWGSEDVDYDAIRRHANLLKTIPNLFAFGLGDFNEFAKLKHRSAIDGQIHAPTVQARGVRAMFLETWQKWLAVVLGNHDMRTYLESGFDIGEYLIGEVPPGQQRIPFMRDGGLVTIEHGSQVYTHNIFHGDSAFGTRFNENHKGRQTARLVDGVTDVVWNGHTHNPAIQDASMPSDDMAGARDAVFIQLGSYKVHGDEYSRRRKFMEVSDVQMGAIIQFPDAKVKLPFKRVEHAVFMLRWLTKAYESGATIKDVLPDYGA